MQRLIAFLTASLVLALALPVLAQSKPSVWVPPPMGSLIGGGYADSGRSSQGAKAQAGHRTGENSDLAKAMALLDAQTGTVVQGYGLVSAAVAWQTKVPVAKLKEQQKATGLAFSDLLVANSLAEGTAKDFSAIIAMQRQAGAWTPLIKNMRVSMDSIVARTKAAESSVRYAEARNNRRREENKRDNLPSRLKTGPPASQHGG
jgi:hypothetical protein